MYLTPKHPDSSKIRVYDVRNNPVEGVSEFDTDTCEAVVYLYGANGPLVQKNEDGTYSTVKVKVTIPGAYAKYDNGEVIK